MRKKELSMRLLYTTAISIVICIVISVVFFDGKVTYGLILKSIGLGIAIWFVSEILFDLILKKWPHQILPSYIVLFIVIAVGTGVGSWLIGVTIPSVIVLICLCAEICGFLIAVVYRQNYKKRLNTQLEKFKNER